MIQLNNITNMETLKVGKPNAYILVGIPGAGKSTWLAQQEWAKNCVVISSDNLIEDYAASVNKTYNDVFKQRINIATNEMFANAMDARDAGRDIIWDQTSVNVASRKKKLNMLGSKYRKIAVVFATPETNELKRRLNSRPGKSIPFSVIESMLRNFQMPDVNEGFDEVWTVG